MREGSKDRYNNEQSAGEKTDSKNHKIGSGVTSLEDTIQDSRMKSRIDVRLTDSQLPKVRAILEEAVNTSSVTDVERMIRKQIREQRKSLIESDPSYPMEDYFDNYFTEIIRKKTDKATYGPQILTWEVFSSLYHMIMSHELEGSKWRTHMRGLKKQQMS